MPASDMGTTMADTSRGRQRRSTTNTARGSVVREAACALPRQHSEVAAISALGLGAPPQRPAALPAEAVSSTFFCSQRAVAACHRRRNSPLVIGPGCGSVVFSIEDPAPWHGRGAERAVVSSLL